MSATNNITLIGRLVEDPELKKTQSDISVLQSRIAVQRNFKNKDGNYEADFINFNAFRGLADFISNNFHKGDMIAINGELRAETYQKNDGNRGYRVDVSANNASFCGSKSEKSSSDHNKFQTKQKPTQSAELPIDDDGEDLPW